MTPTPKHDKDVKPDIKPDIGNDDATLPEPPPHGTFFDNVTRRGVHGSVFSANDEDEAAKERAYHVEMEQLEEERFAARQKSEEERKAEEAERWAYYTKSEEERDQAAHKQELIEIVSAAVAATMKSLDGDKKLSTNDSSAKPNGIQTTSGIIIRSEGAHFTNEVAMGRVLLSRYQCGNSDKAKKKICDRVCVKLPGVTFETPNDEDILDPNSGAEVASKHLDIQTKLDAFIHWAVAHDCYYVAKIPIVDDYHDIREIASATTHVDVATVQGDLS